MIRPVLAISAGLLCGLYGMQLSRSLTEDARNLRRWADILTHLDLLLGEAALSLPCALREAANGNLPPDRCLQAVADALADNPLTSLPQAFAAAFPAGKARDPLLRLASRLGRGSAESRRLAVRQATDALALMATQAEARAARDVRLFRTLGFTGGACLTLLLL